MADRRLSEDAQVILLLCSRFGPSDRSEVLTLGEYNRVARWLRSARMRPADLLDGSSVAALGQGAGIAEERLRGLLGRGMQLALAVDRWSQAGIWVVCRSDGNYPARCRAQLSEQAPPVLYGAGTQALLAGGGLAVVGSRGADEECLAFAAEVGARCAHGRIPVVSGGARGVDAAVMSGALAAGGTVIGVVADTLLERSLSRDARAGLVEGRLLLVSPYYPEAGFNTGNAMARNKMIYALADYGLVVCSGRSKGGTWAGAVEELKRKLGRPVFVRVGGTGSDGNRALIDEGALPFPALRGEPVTLEWLGQASDAGRQPPSAIELSLLPGIETPQMSAGEVREPSPEPAAEPMRANESVPSALPSIYEAALRALIAALDTPRSVDDLLACLAHEGVTRSQMQVWLKRAVAEGAIRRLTRPVRYARKEPENADAGE